MGFHKVRRPLLSPRGLQIGDKAGSTFTSDIVLSTAGSSDAAVKHVVQSISPSGGSTGTVPHATTITNRGVTVITSTGTGALWTFNLAAPQKAGVEKWILINPKSTVPVRVRTASSAQPFFGSTANAFEASTLGTTGNLIGKGKAVRLISVSTTEWAITSFFPQNTTGSTYLTLLGATA